MSSLYKTENSNLENKKEKLSNNGNYLWSEINTEQKYQTISTNEDYLINNNINQNLQILEIKSLLDTATKDIIMNNLEKNSEEFEKEYSIS